LSSDGMCTTQPLPMRLMHLGCSSPEGKRWKSFQVSYDSTQDTIPSEKEIYRLPKQLGTIEASAHTILDVSVDQRVARVVASLSSNARRYKKRRTPIKSTYHMSRPVATMSINLPFPSSPNWVPKTRIASLPMTADGEEVSNASCWRWL
jgi:hypothetical protein